MGRPPKPERKNELLDQIVDYLLDKTFATLSFRTLADGLGISSYVLVYHFGNREELINEIVRHIEARHDALKPANPEKFTREDFRSWIVDSWNWLLVDRNRNLQRLEFEASVQDVVSPTPRASAVRKFVYWQSFTAEWLVSQGIERRQADPFARLFISSLYGLQYDYVLNQDRTAVEEALELLLDRFFYGLDVAASPTPGR
ncbi:TetR/AcrR family transcriptional regulator [uncultured Arthrobacter sp.]|uniref:TetR/AcrR family transcriptional regulator n=1 Tax=uncultured Arthrobacter sp. TaxID=114050 RepID=UPI00262E896E|nr:TetR/AcrR family transcriptional regulator [uncultured Arthrobacter sp.]